MMHQSPCYRLNDPKLVLKRWRNNKKPKEEQKMATKIGALWRNKMKDGSTYFSGKAEFIVGHPVNIVMFPYKPKDNKVTTKSPAYTLHIQTPMVNKPNKVISEDITEERVMD
jgi:hypothetical protein